jgi:hypothetical protein
MTIEARVAVPSSRFDDFLFAVICEEADGSRLSVLSALARANVDPWDEAERLSSLSPAAAERSLTATLAAAGNIWTASEQATIARSLVQLLPAQGEHAHPAPAQSGAPGLQLSMVWLLWWGIIVGATVFMPHKERATTLTGTAAPYAATEMVAQDESGIAQNSTGMPERMKLPR